jgi:hypothetical protein
MYSWIFRHLPGPFWVRAAISLAMAAGALFVLVQVVFPWIADITNLTGATVGQG